MTERKLVIIGGDAAGMSAASLAKRRQPELEIEVYEMGDYTSYGACGMPYYVAGDIEDLHKLVAVTPEQFEQERGIKVFMRHQVEKIFPDRKAIKVLDLKTGQPREAGYDELLIATGAAPMLPPGVDTSLKGVFSLRWLPDADAIKKYIVENNCREAVVVGAGYIGAEMTEALTSAGLKVTVLELLDRVMGIYEPEISELVLKEMEQHGVNVVLGQGLAGLEESSGDRLKVIKSDGGFMETDMVVFGIGVRPRSELAAEAGLKLGVKNAISVDRRQKTSVPHIWSAGDCAEAYHLLLKRNAYIPLALTANRAGRIAGSNLVGLEAEFPGILGTGVCKVFDLTTARTGLGLQEALDEGLDAVKVNVTSRSRPHYYPGSAQVHTILIVEKSTQRLLGAQMAGVDGVAHRINTFAASLAAEMTLADINGLDLAYAPPFSPVWDPILIASEVGMKKLK